MMRIVHISRALGPWVVRCSTMFMPAQPATSDTSARATTASAARRDVFTALRIQPLPSDEGAFEHDAAVDDTRGMLEEAPRHRLHLGAVAELTQEVEEAAHGT